MYKSDLNINLIYIEVRAPCLDPYPKLPEAPEPLKKPKLPLESLQGKIPCPTKSCELRVNKSSKNKDGGNIHSDIDFICETLVIFLLQIKIWYGILKNFVLNFEKFVNTITTDMNWDKSWRRPLKHWNEFPEYVEFVANDQFFDHVNFPCDYTSCRNNYVCLSVFSVQMITGPCENLMVACAILNTSPCLKVCDCFC